MKTLFIHPGFPKTGSSFLQVFFAQNASLLRDSFSLHYALPDHPSSQRALEGGISSGNGQFLINRLDAGADISHALSDYLDSACDNSLISWESWGTRVPQSLNNAIKAEAERLGYRVRCIAFRRDPFELSISAYMQRVKRGGLGDSFEQFTKRFRDNHTKWEDLLSKTYPLEILSYSKCRHDLLACLFQQMGFDTNKLPREKAVIINRSLSREECLFLVRLNAHHKNRTLAGLVSDRLVNDHPFSGTPLRHTETSFTNVCEALGLNPEEEAQRLDFVADSTPLDPTALTKAATRIQGYLCDLLETAPQVTQKREVSDQALRKRSRLLKAKNLCLLAADATARTRRTQVEKACGNLKTAEDYKNLIEYLNRHGRTTVANDVISHGIGLGFSELADKTTFVRKRPGAPSLKRLWKG